MEGMIWVSYTTQQQVERFINEYMSSRVVVEASVRAILNRALGYEAAFKKPFYDFTQDEVLQMFKESHTISITAIQSANTILRHASNWMKFEKGENQTNAYQTITKEDLKQCIDTAKKDSLLITRDQLNDIQMELLNATDRAILEMLFLGAGGRWCKELSFLSRDNLSTADKCVYFRTGKQLHVGNKVIDLLLEAFNETELVSYSGLMKISKVKSLGIYKLRSNALSDNSDPSDEKDQERRFRFIQRRLHIISEYVGIELKASTIQDGGLLHHIKHGITASDMPFREFVNSDQGRVLARQYDIYSEFAPSVLISKFIEYFT